MRPIGAGLLNPAGRCGRRLPISPTAAGCPCRRHWAALSRPAAHLRRRHQRRNRSAGPTAVITGQPLPRTLAVRHGPSRHLLPASARRAERGLERGYLRVPPVVLELRQPQPQRAYLGVAPRVRSPRVREHPPQRGRVGTAGAAGVLWRTAERCGAAVVRAPDERGVRAKALLRRIKPRTVHAEHRRRRDERAEQPHLQTSH